jgi:hypothetical protein
MFADTDFTDLDKWDMIGNHFGVGTIFSIMFLLFFVTTTWYTLKASFGKTGILREFFTGIKNAAEEFLTRLTLTLDRLETAANESKEYHREQAAVCKSMYNAHVDPTGPANLDHLKAAAAHGLDALQQIGVKTGANIDSHIAAAKNELIP